MWWEGGGRGSCKSQLAGFPWLQLVPAVSAQLPLIGLTGDYYSGAGHTNGVLYVMSCYACDMAAVLVREQCWLGNGIG